MNNLYTQICSPSSARAQNREPQRYVPGAFCGYEKLGAGTNDPIQPCIFGISGFPLTDILLSGHKWTNHRKNGAFLERHIKGRRGKRELFYIWLIHFKFLYMLFTSHTRASLGGCPFPCGAANYRMMSRNMKLPTP